MKREGFASRLGMIAAAAGSAIGLGNIWRFPYITGKGGGAAFIVIYLIFIVFIGMSCLLTEFVIGRRGQSDAIGSFLKLSRNKYWSVGGWLCVITVSLIFSFYIVVFGWTINYLVKSIFNIFADKTPQEIGILFSTTTSSVFSPIVYAYIGLGITAFVVVDGIEHGIEKCSKILMPLLFALMVILLLRSLTLPGAGKGIAFLLKPDFSKVTTEVILIALGQAFFTLSLGAAVMITYGSYINKKERMGSAVVQICFINCSISLLAGFVIFPAAFTFGINPGEGPGLAFVTLPNIFQQMTGGYYFAIIFFLLLTVASLTSTISMLEAIVACIREQIMLTRKQAIAIGITIVAILCIPCSLSFGPMNNTKIFGHTFFDICNLITSNYGMPIGSLIFVFFVGWFFGKDNVKDELSNSGKLPVRYFPYYLFTIRFIVPIAILIIFLTKLGVF
ncbi:MAG: sodium-dependent transporter [Victivallales bacterium]|nr:sodium-dependent transporter [Victivallales bacterium]MCF7889009.1 sodium-dependent transporter [Victivallales bacterium]